MSEKTTLVKDKLINYNGLIDYKEFYKVIDTWCAEHGYTKVEHKNFEEIFEDGKQIILEIAPNKKITDYAKIEFYVYIEFKKAQEKVIERDGLKRRYYQANLFLNFDCFLITDYEKNWDTKPLYYFFRTLVDKFIFKEHTTVWKKQGTKDCESLMNEVKNYLNMERFK